MSASIRAFVNGRPINVAPNSTILDVVTNSAPELRDALEAGRAYVTDGVGRRVPLTQTVVPGLILRIVRTARKQTS